MKRFAEFFSRRASRRTRRSAPANVAAATARRAGRARSHLERRRRRDRSKLETDRLRGRGQQPSKLPEPIRRLALWAPAALALALGVQLSWPIQTWIAGDSQRIARISVAGARHLSPSAIAAATGIVPGAALTSVDVGDVAALLEQEPFIRKARALLLPPGTLLLEVEEREPVAIWLGADGAAEADAQLVDHEGHVFASAADFENTNLPRLIGARERTAETEFAEAARLGRRIDALGLAATNPREGIAAAAPAFVIRLPDPATGEGFVLESSSPSLRVILGRDHLEERLDRLDRLLRSQEPSVQAATVIDLRFADRAVLRTSSAG